LETLKPSERLIIEMVYLQTFGPGNPQIDRLECALVNCGIPRPAKMKKQLARISAEKNIMDDNTKRN
jgi:hypothetical protein